MNDLSSRYRKVDEDFFEELEEILIQADVGFETVMTLIDELRSKYNVRILKTRLKYSVISEKLVEIYETGEENYNIKDSRK